MKKRRNTKEKDPKRYLWFFVFLTFLIIFIAWLINLKVLLSSKSFSNKDSLLTEIKDAVFNLKTSFGVFGKNFKNSLPFSQNNSLSNQEVETLKEKVLEKVKNQ